LSNWLLLLLVVLDVVLWVVDLVVVQEVVVGGCSYGQE
jgi:hypothetical protein